MEFIFIGIVAFLFILAVFDLTVGVSNHAVNFLQSAVGAKAAPFRTVVIVAAVGVFIGAIMSNGMMDIARHGIFKPEQFSFFEIICIFMAVMVTDIILLDIFNSLGMPTSTTVSMVFELLGAAFALALFKLAGDESGLTFADLLNTEKALSVIIGIFLSVAIAFFFGTVVQYLTRLWFRFDYKKGLSYKIGIFGGLSITAIVYFLLIKGAKDLTFMTPDVKDWIHHHTLLIILGCFVLFTVISQLLYWLKVNVFKVIVLTGTFALAMAFAGNDLVNFIGVPLTGFASYQDYAANGAGDMHDFTMGSLNGPASTPLYFLLGAGVIMVASLATSKKARKVVGTSVNLSRQDAGDEMFGSSRIARRLVRLSLSISQAIVNYTPASVRHWVAKRLDPNKAIMEDGAAFDLVRGSINLVLAGALIALGTSLKLPLSTTYVTFMVAMGTSLADRAWGRESAVFRITGVISVIGGWFITAGVAFIGAAIIASLMRIGGVAVIIAMAVVAVGILIYSNLRKKIEEKSDDNDTFQSIILTEDKAEAWSLLQDYVRHNQRQFLSYASDMQQTVYEGFLSDNVKALSKAVDSLTRQKAVLKSLRRKATLCLRRIDPITAVEKSAWFHLANNCQMSMLYNLRRIAEACYEHVDNNFAPLPRELAINARPLLDDVNHLLRQAQRVTDFDDVVVLRNQCDEIKDELSTKCVEVYRVLQDSPHSQMSVLYVYLNLLQETQEIVSNLRKLLRADVKLMQTNSYSQK